MFNRCLLALLSAGVAAGALSAGARADSWFDFPFIHHHRAYYAGSDYMPDGTREMTPEEFDRVYSHDFDPNYYNPTYMPPSGKPKLVKKKPASQATLTAPAQMAPDKTVIGSTDGKATAPATTAAAQKPMSCDKAQGIVSGYGFTSVKPADCEGQVYAFNAARDGKSYAIKLNAVSGELTEVKKAQ